MEFIKRLKISKKVQKYLIKSMIVLFLIMITMFFTKTIISIAVSIILMTIGIISTLYKKVINLPIGFELTTFVTIIFAFAHSPLTAFIASIIMTIAGAALINRICIPVMIKIVVYGIVCSVALFFDPEQIRAGGKILVILFNILLHATYVFIFRFKIENSVISFILNIILNIFLIDRLGELLVGML